MCLERSEKHGVIPPIRTATSGRKQKRIHRRISVFGYRQQSPIHIFLLTGHFYSIGNAPHNIARSIRPETKHRSTLVRQVRLLQPSPGALLHLNPLNVTLVNLINNKFPLVLRIFCPLRVYHSANGGAHEFLRIAVSFHQILFGVVLAEEQIVAVGIS